jgi:N-acetylglucosaminyldiphosphoundecaprenol N-acetyl-beta-D-mannosaminyltransferase
MRLDGRQILDVRVDAVDYESAIARILRWARQGRSSYICCACVHSIMVAHDSSEYRNAMRNADLVTPDGMPLVWLLRWLGIANATRVCGPDLMPRVLEAAASGGIRVGFYGGTEGVLHQLVDRAKSLFPGLRVTYAVSPPFRPLTPKEDADTTSAIIDSGSQILFVGLGTPRQDPWMNVHRGRIPAVMLGVGAAFDFFAGSKRQAPRWMQRSGLEWLFRLATEPRRLWRRYVLNNPRFVILAVSQLFRERLVASSAKRKPAMAERKLGRASEQFRA